MVCLKVCDGHCSYITFSAGICNVCDKWNPYTLQLRRLQFSKKESGEFPPPQGIVKSHHTLSSIGHGKEGWFYKVFTEYSEQGGLAYAKFPKLTPAPLTEDILLKALAASAVKKEA